MLDHLILHVRDYAASKRFYLAALAPLGYALVREVAERQCGLGQLGKPDFWLAAAGGPARSDDEPAAPPRAAPLHFAFRARTRDEVDAFHAAALEAGARDNGPPGLRTHYHSNYYGAFVFDPDGNNVEVVCHSNPHRMASLDRDRRPPRRLDGDRHGDPSGDRDGGGRSPRRSHDPRDERRDNRDPRGRHEGRPRGGYGDGPRGGYGGAPRGGGYGGEPRQFRQDGPRRDGPPGERAPYRGPRDSRPRRDAPWQGGGGADRRPRRRDEHPRDDDREGPPRRRPRDPDDGDTWDDAGGEE